MLRFRKVPLNFCILISVLSSVSFATLLCDFKNDFSPCLEASPLPNNLKWTVMPESGHPNNDLPPLQDDGYVYLDISGDFSSGDSAVLKTPLVTSDDNVKCINFVYYIFGTRISKLRLIRNCFPNSTNDDTIRGKSVEIWHRDGTSEVKPHWNFDMAYAAPEGADNCEFLFLAEVLADSVQGAVAIDTIIGGECEPIKQPSHCEFDTPCFDWEIVSPEDLHNPWSGSATGVTFESTTATDFPPLKADHSSMVAAGGILAMRAPEPGCYYAQMAETISNFLDLNKTSYCMRFYAKTVIYDGELTGENSAEIAVHLLRTATEEADIISTVWKGRLEMDRNVDTWQAVHVFTDIGWAKLLDDQGLFNLKFVVSARFCSSTGGGIAIDDLSKLMQSEEKFCRLPGDENLEGDLPFWETTDVSETSNSWIAVPSDHMMSFPSPYGGDHTFLGSSTGFVLTSHDDLNEVSRLQSAGTLNPTFARCVNFRYQTGTSAMSLTVYIVPIAVDGSEPEEEKKLVYQYNARISPSLEWALAAFSYYSRLHHKILIEATGAWMLDDFTFNDGTCSCRPSILPGDICSLPEITEDAQWPPSEIDEFYSRVGDCQPSVPTLKLFTDISLLECNANCKTVGSDCQTFVYDFTNRKCELKAEKCYELVSSTDKKVYQSKVTTNYYGQPGSCSGLAILLIFGLESAEECGPRCDVESDCSIFVFYPTERKCFLYSDTCIPIQQSVNSERFEMVEFEGFQMYSGICDMYGKTTTFKNVTRRNCMNTCRDDVNCATFVYETSKATCVISEDRNCAMKPELFNNYFTYIKTKDVEFSCDFESTCNSWSIDATSSKHFTVVSSKDGHGLNGPIRDVTLKTNDQGHYLLLPYYSVLDPVDEPSTVANFESTLIDPGNAGCFTFFFYMFGPSVGSLSVYVVEEGSPLKEPVWYKSGSNADTWTEVRISLSTMSLTKSFAIIFEADLMRDGVELPYVGSLAIDDIVVSPHNCLPIQSHSCQFEGHDGCSIAEAVNFEVKQLSGTSNPSDIPPTDHTYQTGVGHYSLAQLVTGETAVFAINYDARHDRCASFWYRRGSKCTRLEASARSRPADGDNLAYNIVLKNFDEPQENWSHVYVSLPAVGTADGLFEIVALVDAATASECDTSTNWLTIDDVQILPYGCARKTFCNFESPTCTFSTDESIDNAMPWLYGFTPKLTNIPAPSTDHTLQYDNLGGGYLFIDQDVYRNSIGHIAYLRSEWLRGSGNAMSVSFFYYINGPESGILQCYLITKENGVDLWNPMWQVNSDQSETEWKFGRFRIPSNTTEFKLVFSALRGTNSYAKLAVDDVMLMDGFDGSLYPPQADPTIPITTKAPMTTTTPVTPYPTFPPSTIIFTCNFEIDDCFFVPESQNSWVRVCGEVDECQTEVKGPIGDHTEGSMAGHYFLLWLNSPNNLTFLLQRSYTNNDESFCLSLWYYNYRSGQSISSGQSETLYWKRSDSTNTWWQYAEYTIDGTDPVSSVFFGGSSNDIANGYVAIDDITFVKGPCPRRDLECNFESSTFCDSSSRLVQGNAEWKFGNTADGDHTLQTNRGHYAYVTATGNINYTVELVQSYTPESQSNDYCLQFWYKLGPNGEVIRMNACVDDCSQFSAVIAPNQGSSWTFTEIDLSIRPETTFDLIFRATYGFSGSIPAIQTVAVDDIKILQHACEKQHKCSFESGLCGWHSDLHAQFSWLLDSGYYGGPIGLDYSSQSSQGHYVSAPLKPPIQRGDVARLQSPSRNAETKGCLRFAFYSYSNTLGDATSLRLKAETSQGSRTIWVTTDRANDQWQLASAPVDMELLNLAYNLAFEAVFDSPEYEGVMALDDVDFDLASAGCPSSLGIDPTAYALSEMKCPNGFENDFCHWKPDQNANDNLTWKNQVDPIDDIYSATISYQLKQSEFSTFIMSTEVPGNDRYCFEFEYSFHGTNPGSVHLVLQDGSTASVVWARSSSQGYTYRQGLVSIVPTFDFSLTFQVFGASETEVNWSGTFSIRSTLLFSGQCPKPENDFCDFETDDCNWFVDISANSWERGLAVSSMQNDHSTGTEFGHAMRVMGDTYEKEARLVHLLSGPPSADRCLIFWHLLDNDNDETALRVHGIYMNGIEQYSKMLWERKESTGSNWELGYANIPTNTSVESFELAIGAQIKLESTIAAVDDMLVEIGTCPPAVNCDWEVSSCGYVPIDDTKIPMTWTSAGSMDTSDLAPKQDHTTGSNFGHYLYVDSDMLLNQADSALSSPLAGPYSLESCIEIFYSMTGPMKLFIVQTAGSSVNITEETGGTWQRALVRVMPDQTFWLQFHVQYQSNESPGFVAVDDIVFRDGVICENVDLTTTFVPATAEPIADFSCSFNDDICGWSNAENVEFTFQRTSGQVSDDGPVGDFEGTGSYIYLAGSGENMPNGTARLISPQYPADLLGSPSCFQFRYFLNGKHVDTLSVYKSDASKSESLIWTRSRSQGNKWILGHFYFIADDPTTAFVFEASKLVGESGVIALDDFYFYSGSCSSFAYCDFEDHKLCNWQHDPQSTAQWRLVQGEDLNFGPSVDHTYGSDFGTFLHFGINSDTPTFQYSSLLSQEYQLLAGTAAGCMRVWLWTAGEPVTVSASLIPTDNGIDLPDQAVLLFTFEYSSGPWRRTSAPLAYYGTFRIRLEASGFADQGSVSVDDIFVSTHEGCGEPAHCNFETDQCGWQNSNLNHNDWTEHRGPTESLGTGPSIDHTTGTSSGSFMYLESSKQPPGQESVFESEIISPFRFDSGKACFRFWYHMYGGPEMGTLEVLQLATGSEVYWNMTGNQGDEWKRALVDFDVAGTTVILRIRGTLGGNDQSDMAIDDTVLLPGTCEQYDDSNLPHQTFNCSRPRPDGQITLPLNKRCDFVPDCPDGDDEELCHFSCNFDSSPENCAWVSGVSSNSVSQWKWGHGNDAETKGIGPALDHTSTSEEGGYEYIGPRDGGSSQAHSDFYLHLSPTADECSLSFWYQLTNTSSRNHLDLTFGLGDSKFDVSTIETVVSPETWEYFNFKIGRVHTDFTLMIRGYKLSPSENVVAIDDIELTNCAFPRYQGVPCGVDQFTCVQSGACIGADSVCDLSDNCGDGSDEANCGSSKMYCDFESSNCGFYQESGKWYRGTNSYMEMSEFAPSRDHTTGLYYGYTMYSASRGSSKLRSAQSYYVSDDTCKLTFYYQAYSDNHLLTLSLIREVDGFQMTINGPFSNTLGAWVKQTIKFDTIEHNEAFILEFQADSSSAKGYVAIDDLTMSSGCHENDGEACLAPEYYRCKPESGVGVGKCISSHLVGDFYPDCPLGDDEYGYGPCDFEPESGSSQGSNCGWSFSSDAFTIQQVSPTSSIYPKTDGSLNAKGWYLHADPVSIFEDEPPFVLTSPALPAMTSSCKMRSSIWVDGPNSTEKLQLTVIINSPEDTEPRTVGSWIVPVMSSWQEMKPIDFIPSYPNGSHVIIEVQPKDTFRGRNDAVLGIDDIAFVNCSTTHILPDVTCNFNDQTICSWTQGTDITPQLDWAFGNGSQSATLGGPGTPFDGSGYYLFISQELLKQGRIQGFAQLVSPWYEPMAEPFCLKFVYHVYGPFQPGTLRIRVYSENTYVSLFARTTSQGNQWRVGYVTVNPPESRYYLMVYGHTVFVYQGHVAIDNIEIWNGACPEQLALCDFEFDQCKWTSEASDPYDFAWERIRRSEVPHPDTSGPQQDHTTELNSGYFIQIEAENRLPGDRAGVISPEYLIPKGAISKNCFRFWYHMYGPSVGDLIVNVYPVYTRRVVFMRSGNHGNHWWEGKIQISSSDFESWVTNFNVAIEGVVGDSAESDIAIDDVGLTNGTCAPVATCDFEQNQCGWSNIFEISQAEWLRNNNATTSQYSGPSSDHTLGNSSGYYMYIDSSLASETSFAKTAYYASEIVQGSSTGHCFSFWYHMSGSAVGTLAIQQLYPTKILWENSTIWSLSGKQGDDWKQGKVNIFTSEEYAIVLAANMSSTPGESDIAVDDLYLDMSGPCPDVTTPQPIPPPEMFAPCGFEQSNCAWQVYGSSPYIDWHRATGSYLVIPSAPLADHTRLDQSGHYLLGYTNDTEEHYVGKELESYAITESRFYTTNRHCIVKFFCYSDDGLDGVDVFFGVQQFGSEQRETLWHVSSLDPKTWNPVSIDIGYNSESIQLFLMMKTSSSTSVAFDDFTFVDCNPPVPKPSCSDSEFRCNNEGCISEVLTCDGSDNCGDYSDESSMVCSNRLVLTMEDQETVNKFIELVPVGGGDASMSWSLGSGPTLTDSTGPRFDHSFANSSGHYYYLNVGSLEFFFEKAWMALPVNASFSNQDTCQLRFYYHMYGIDIGALSVFYRTQMNGPITELWRRSGEAGDKWLLATVDLSSIGQNFQVVIEGQAGRYYASDIAIDDISFTEGCQVSSSELPEYSTVSPPTSTTPAPCPTNSTLFSCYNSPPDYQCIKLDYVCNFKSDCPAGEDEAPPNCVKATTIFDDYSSLSESGWKTSTDNTFQWELINPLDIPFSCQGACPSIDFQGYWGRYAAADSSKATNMTDHGRLTQNYHARSAGPQCEVEFYYISYSSQSSYIAGSLSAYINTVDPYNSSIVTSKRIWGTSMSIPNWQKVSLVIGYQSSSFFLEFAAESVYSSQLPAVAAIDGIAFKNCEEVEPQVSCSEDEFRCSGSQGCIDPKFKCDFGDHCGDGNLADVTSSSDEKPELCDTAYVARCAFDDPALECDDWDYDSTGEYRWRISPASESYEFDMPNIDHTTHLSSGHILLLNYEYNYGGLRTARYKTTSRFVVSEKGDKCRLRFWLYIHAPDIDTFGTVHVLMRTSYAPLTETYLANYTSDLGDIWVRQEIAVTLAQPSVPFELVIEGKLDSYGMGGGIAVDDISMTPDCHETPQLLPGQDSYQTSTHIHPTCDSELGNYQCADGNGCYSLAQRCDFVNECSDGSDDVTCTYDCTFDDESNLCNWKTSIDLPGEWVWSSLNNTVPEWGPPGDHTPGGGTSGYLETRGGARLQSSLFQHASPACTLQFWYWYYQVGSSEPGVMSVSVKDGTTGINEYFHVEATYMTTWQQANVTIYSTDSFEVYIDVPSSNTRSYAAIDDVKWLKCVPEEHAVTCLRAEDFQCKDGLKCITPGKVCDFQNDCKDGSDEDERLCEPERAPGSCTFENANWEKFCNLQANQTGELIAWTTASVSSIKNGPQADHTSGTSFGKVAFIDGTKADVGYYEEATMSTTTGFPPNVKAPCNCRFYYYFYRSISSEGLGKIKVMTYGAETNTAHTRAQVSLSTIQPGSSTSDVHGTDWVRVEVPIMSEESFSIYIVAEIDSNPFSIMAVDDLSLSSSCLTDNGQISNNTGCPPGEAKCSRHSFECIPESFFCDGECDCINSNCNDESDCHFSSTSTSSTTTTTTTTTTKTQSTTTTTTRYAPTTEKLPITTTITKLSTTFDSSSTTTESGGGGNDDLALILGVTFGVLGLVVLVGIGIWLIRKYRPGMVGSIIGSMFGSSPQDLVPDAGLQNPTYSGNDDEIIDPSLDKTAVLLTELPFSELSSNDTIIDNTDNGDL